MSEAKGDLIFLPSREHGLFWFSLDNEQSLSPIFLKASDPGEPLYMFFLGEGSSPKSNQLRRNKYLYLP